jgi:hypothetical protein
MTPEQWRRYADTLELDSGRSPVRQLGYAPLSPATRSALAGDAPPPAGPFAVATLSAPLSSAAGARFGAPDQAPLARALRTGNVALGIHPADDDTSRDTRILMLFVPATPSSRTPVTPAGAHARAGRHFVRRAGPRSRSRERGRDGRRIGRVR